MKRKILILLLFLSVTAFSAHAQQLFSQDEDVIPPELDRCYTKGMQFLEVDRSVFRQALTKTSFYSDWKTKFGDEAWAQLEKAAGKLG